MQIENLQTGQAVQAHGAIVGRLLAGPGTVSHEGAPQPVGVSGQQVMVIDPSSGARIAAAITASDGSFRLQVPPGAYVVEAAGERQQVRVGSGEEVKLNLALPVQ